MRFPNRTESSKTGVKSDNFLKLNDRSIKRELNSIMTGVFRSYAGIGYESAKIVVAQAAESPERTRQDTLIRKPEEVQRWN